MYNTSNIYYNEIDKIDTNVSINEYSNNLDKNYEYSSYYDCKFYAYMWSRYAINNNLSYKIIPVTNNHVETTIYNESQYCISTNNNINCYSIN